MTAGQALGVMLTLGSAIVLAVLIAAPALERRRARRTARVAAHAVPSPVADQGRAPVVHAPFRCPVHVPVSPVTGEHDRIEDITASELLLFAALVGGLRERPATAIDRTDPDAAAPR